MKKTLLWLLWMLPVSHALPFQDIQKAGTIRIGTEGAFKPFNYFEGKKLTGFEVDLANALAKHMNLKVQWIPQSFDSLLIGLNQNRYDFVIASHGITPERQKAVDFTDPHYCTGGLIVSKPGGPKTAKDLMGKLVAVQVGTSYLDNVRKVAGVKDVKTYARDPDAEQALLSGRVDAWVSDKFLALDAIKAAGTKIQAGDLLFQEKVAMAVQKGNTTLKTELNKALKAILASGEYAKISQKYFMQDIRCK